MRCRRTVWVVATVLSLVVVGCSEDPAERSAGSPDGASGNPAGSVATTTTTFEAEAFTGPTDDFYVVPNPLPEVAPGDLIRTQEVATATSGRTVRIMYRSDDAAGRPRGVTGTVTVPAGEPPAGGWPIVTVAPGTVGLASRCALSRNGGPVLDVGVPAIRVMTDYIGMGPVGETMPYLSRTSEGNSVLDAARAARSLAGGDASATVAIFGHSQGGHGAQSAHELAEERAPELEVVGTVSVAPAAMFDRTYGGIDDFVSRIVTTMSLYGAATERDDIVPTDYVNSEVAEASAVLWTDCLDTIITTLVPFAVRPDYWNADPLVTEPAVSLMRENDVGNVGTDAPLLLIGGTADERVVAQRVVDLRDRLCSVGQVTQFVMLDGADHSAEVPRAMPQISAWIADRFVGRPATDDCA